MSAVTPKATKNGAAPRMTLSAIRDQTRCKVIGAKRKTANYGGPSERIML
jgi:hypothetical protein